MTGKLYVIVGRAGAGKSTLMRGVLAQRSEVALVTTLTTRPKRADDADSLEHSFVTDQAYAEARQAALHWYETTYAGYHYGSDAGRVMQLLAAGRNVVVIIAPDPANFAGLQQLGGDRLVSIWIDTPAEVSHRRIAGDQARAARPEDESLRDRCTYVFTPTGDLAADTLRLAELFG